MKKHDVLLRTFLVLSCGLLLACPFSSCGSDTADPNGGGDQPPVPAENRLTLIHTNDMHSHLQGVPEADYRPLTTGDGTQGGIARIATKVSEVRAANHAAGVPTLLLDAGDFMMGTLFHLLAGEAEMGIMNHLGYDSFCLGNHEFDWMPAGAARIVTHADPLRAESANLEVTDPADPGGRALQDLIEQGKILPFSVRTLPNGLRAGLFGILGENADHVIFRPDPEHYPVAFTDRIEAARNTVELLRSTEGADIVICLSHSGVDSEDHTKGEDPELAEAVPGIDVIVSGHTHTDMPDPVVMPGGTLIVQALAYTLRLGVLDLERIEGAWRMRSYTYVPIDDSILGDAETQSLVEGYMRKVDDEFLHPLGYSFEQQIARTDFDMTKVAGEEFSLGDLVTDSIRWAVDRVENVPGNPKEGPVSFSVESNGVIRDPILQGRQGRINVSDAFRVVPLGFDPTAATEAKQAGYPLISFYLTGDEIRQATEVDATAYALLGDSDYWLSYSGLTFSYLSKGIPFLRVQEIDRCTLPVAADPACVSREKLDTGKDNPTLYKVACNYYVGLNIKMLKEKSYGILDVQPKDRNGNVIEDLTQAIVRRPDGTGLKEYEGFFDYLASFPVNAESIPVIPERYQGPQGRIVDSCFVATVAYGSPFAAQVKTLRQFRDEILGASSWGRRVIAFYYRHGKDAAAVVADHPWLRAAARTALLPLVGTARILLWAM
jgi:5'-nucleotidase / UDP-sugar diphosphatase